MTTHLAYPLRFSGVKQSGRPPELSSLDPRFLDLLPVAVYFCDTAGTLVQWNEAAVDLWGGRPGGNSGLDRFCSTFKLYGSDGHFLRLGDSLARSAVATRDRVEVTDAILERPDGSRRNVTASADPVENEDGELIGAIVIIQDITDLKQAQQSLLHVERRFQGLLQKLPAAAYICNPEGLVTFYNERAVDLWGREPALMDPVDRYCGSFRLFGSDGEPIRHEECWMALALRNGRDYDSQEIVIERPDGTRRMALAYATPFFKDSGKLAGAINMLVDITQRNDAQKQINELLERERQQSETLREADRRKDEFLAMLAHELRNPLAPIRTGLELLARGSATEETLEVMRSQVDHLVRLVDDLLDVSRIVRGRIELRRQPVLLSSVVNRSLDAMRSIVGQRSQQLVVTLPDKEVWLDADAVRLVQVLENLITNASKYTHNGGRIELTAECGGDEVRVAVADNGIGIDPELLPHVFDLFTQSARSLDRSEGGLGIGLTLVKNLVSMHGGTVAAESAGSGQGSRFLIRLPLAEKGIEMETTPERDVPGEGRRILVVDDSVGAAKMLALLLKHLGPHEIEMAHDGPSAIETARRFRPDILLLDIGLPKMNGLSVARRLREDESFDSMLLVALTGYGQEEDRRRSEAAGFDEHLVKPVDVETLRQLLSHSKLPQVASV